MQFRSSLLAVLIATLVAVPARAHNGHIISADAVSGITIDGDLSDWPSEMKNHFISTVLYTQGGTPADEGFIGRYRVGFDPKENAIYVAVEVEDDSIVLDNIGDEDWNSRDGCELFLSFDHSEKNTSPVQFVYRGGPYAVFENAVNDELGNAVKVARASDDGHILYEWRVDVASLASDKLALAKGAVIGFDVAFLDRDSEELYAFYSSSPGSRKHLSSAELGDLIVPEPNSKSAQIAGRVTWKAPNMRPPKVLNIKAVNNGAMFFQLPLTNGLFMASLPKGEYILTAATQGKTPVYSIPQKMAIQKDTLLNAPIQFEVREPEAADAVVLFDLNHGQQALPRLKPLGSELNYSLKNSKAPITKEALEAVDVLYLLGPTTEFSTDEKAAVAEFVKKGGSLLLVVDESRRTSLETTRANDLVEPFGLKITGDTEYLHNCGGVAKAGTIHQQDLEIPYSGGRAVQGGTPFAFQMDREGQPSHPFAAYVETPAGGKVVVLGEAMASLFLGTPDGERLSGTPRNYLETKFWGKDSARFNADLFAWLLPKPLATTTEAETTRR